MTAVGRHIPPDAEYFHCASGQLVFPTPNAFRSPFRKPDGSYDWEAEMTYGWDLIDRR